MWEAGSSGGVPGPPRPTPPRRPEVQAPRRRPTLVPGGPSRSVAAGHQRRRTPGVREPMSAIRQATSKSLMLFSGRAYPELAEEIAGHLGVSPTPTASYEFANGELFVRFEESVRG